MKTKIEKKNTFICVFDLLLVVLLPLTDKNGDNKPTEDFLLFRCGKRTIFQFIMKIWTKSNAPAPSYQTNRMSVVIPAVEYNYIAIFHFFHTIPTFRPANLLMSVTIIYSYYSLKAAFILLIFRCLVNWVSFLSQSIFVAFCSK